MLREHRKLSSTQTRSPPSTSALRHPAYLFDVCVEGDRHVQQDFALLHTANKVLDPVFELVGGLVDLLWVALSCLGQLLGRLQQLVCISVCILHRGQGMGGQRDGLTQEDDIMKAKHILNTSREREQRLRENDKQDMQETCAVITVSDIRAAKR